MRVSGIDQLEEGELDAGVSDHLPNWLRVRRPPVPPRYITLVSALSAGLLLAPAASAHNAGIAVLDNQPDVSVAVRGMSFPVGAGLANSSGIGQALEVRATPGSTTVLVVGIANAGSTPSAFTLQAPSGGSGVNVRYKAEKTDVTAAVAAGTFLVSDLPPGESAVVDAVVSVPPSTRPGTVSTLRVRSASQTEPSRIDVARLTLKIVETAPHSYRWPLEPAGTQHPIRGIFGDPRIAPHRNGTTSYAFHFGIDLPGRGGTPVYAASSGLVFRDSRHPHRVSILCADGTLFMYWHLRPVARTGQYAIANRTVIGYMRRGHEHVHMAEKVGGRVINPVRPGALGPYRDGLPPSISTIRLERAGRPIEGPPQGRVDIVAEALDTPRLRPLPPFEDAVLTPALVRWRILRGDGSVARDWRTVFDVRRRLPSAPFKSIFAPGTEQNLPNQTAGIASISRAVGVSGRFETEPTLSR